MPKDTAATPQNPTVQNGTQGDDVIRGTDRNDLLNGKKGNDTFIATAGNDTIHGQKGDDTVVFEGNFADYSFETRGNTTFVTGSLGTTEVKQVETLTFADGSVSLTGGNNAPIGGDDSAEVTENGTLVLAAADLLANDADFEGEALSITGVSATSALGVAVSFEEGRITYATGDVFDALAEGETATDTITYTLTDAAGNTDTVTVEITVTGTNDAPVLTLAETAEVPEGTTTVTTLGATDAEGDAVTVTLSGADADLFAYDAQTGDIVFREAPDFETPADAGGDNTYDLSVTASDGNGGETSRDLSVTVTDVIEPRINEIHYDNDRGDTGEFVEVRVAAGADVGALGITLYNGNGGVSYDTYALSDGEKSTDGTYDYYVIDTPGLQNGSPDGLALTDGSTVVEFLSYEGSFVATDGPAEGMDSTDIGVIEPGDTPVGFSLQRAEDGTWNQAAAETRGYATGGTPPAPQIDVAISELAVSTSGTDWEFAELKGTAGQSLDGVALVQVLDGGTVRSVLDFSGVTLGANGYALATSAQAKTTFGIDGDLSFDNNTFQNDPSTFLLISGYDGTLPDDLDGGDDGVIDVDLDVLSSVALTRGGSGELLYSQNTVGPDGTYLPAGAELVEGSYVQTSFGDASTYSPTPAGSSGARINEFHYDNASTDTGEFVEVRVPEGTSPNALEIVLYNGNGGAAYATYDVGSGAKTTVDGFDYYVIDTPGIQNGNDAIALVEAGTVTQFISYEGPFEATDGPAKGMTAVDVGVEETGSTPVGDSVQYLSDGTWTVDAETRGAANDGGVTPPPPAQSLLISQVQGSGFETAYADQTVTLSAIVTDIGEDGFYLMEEASDFDDDAATSEGIYVFTGASYLAGLTAGDQVSVTGTAGEFFGQTQISSVSDVTVTQGGYGVPSPVEVILGPDNPIDYETIESMLINVTVEGEPLTVIENYNLARYGQIVVSSGVQYQPTQIADPDDAATVQAIMEANANNRLILDDGRDTQNPDYFEYLPESGTGNNGNGYLDAGDNFGNDGSTVRLGATLDGGATGIMTYRYGDYQLAVTDQLDFTEGTNTEARPETPDDVGGTLQVSSFNVLNYFTTIDTPGAGTGPSGTLDPRGADSASEFARQSEKIVDGILGTGAEVMALQEIENNGTVALQDLADKLNADPSNTHDWQIVDPTGTSGFVGTDAITTGILYDASAVTLTYTDYLVYEEDSAAQTYALAKVLTDVVGGELGDYQRNRPSVAATFTDDATGKTFTVVSNHFKSKGDSGLQSIVDKAQAYVDGGGTEITQADVDALRNDPNFDQGDGQGFWSGVRTDAARELTQWIETTYGADGNGVDNVLMLGDLNAYAMEDPVQTLDAEYVDLIDTYIGQDEAYSYVFDGQRGTLDQGFADDTLAGSVTGATEWHINADEPGLINYDETFSDSRFYNDGPYSASDHDPLIVGLDFGGGLAA